LEGASESATGVLNSARLGSFRELNSIKKAWRDTGFKKLLGRVRRQQARRE